MMMFIPFPKASPELQAAHIANQERIWKMQQASSRQLRINGQPNRLPSPPRSPRSPPAASPAGTEEASAELSNTLTSPNSEKLQNPGWPGYFFQPAQMRDRPTNYPMFPDLDELNQMEQPYEYTIARKDLPSGVDLSQPRALVRPRFTSRILEEEQHTISSPTVSREAQRYLQQSNLSRMTRSMKHRVTKQTRQSKGRESKNRDLWELDQNGNPCRAVDKTKKGAK
ncbi:uncharacterized protein GGS22DRAFT_125822 [Annulohypoxylon maeteangense]|uniref:uncharacterized protein n=1 Tax=Annulohypoxylon maeteangense TaxID=1927788 RepID=UPI002008C1D5|nr:uncharacterized protein GGS22DRAFT_125822 [Annulohypoxylon maeteangense]KAI0886204.1 hypothetical protein GGS22DRAFT_125822 [Annulohypoxylon maeteangense]